MTRLERRGMIIAERLDALAKKLCSPYYITDDCFRIFHEEMMTIQSDLQALTAEMTDYATTVGAQIAAGLVPDTGAATEADVSAASAAFSAVKTAVAAALPAVAVPVAEPQVEPAPAGDPPL